jgi:hypothetical protein
MHSKTGLSRKKYLIIKVQVQVLYSLGHIYTSVTRGILCKIFYIMTDIANLK